MDEGDALTFGADSGSLIDQSEAGGAAAVEGGIDVVDGEADVMDSGTSGGYEFADWGRGVTGFEKLDQRIPGGKSGDARAIGVVEFDVSQPQDVSVKGKDGFEVPHRDADVGDGRATGSIIHRRIFPVHFWPVAMYNQ